MEGNAVMSGLNLGFQGYYGPYNMSLDIPPYVEA